MKRERQPLNDVSRKANTIGHIGATVLTLILTPVINFFVHSQIIPMLMLSGILYVVIFLYVRVKIFDFIDGA